MLGYSYSKCAQYASRKCNMQNTFLGRVISPLANISAPYAWQASLSIFGWDMRSWFAYFAFSEFGARIFGRLVDSFLSKFRNLKMYTVRIIKRYFAFGEYIHTLRLTSELVDLRVGYAKRIQELCSWATSHRALQKYDANYCIIFLQRYRSGHNGADSKSVCG